MSALQPLRGNVGQSFAYWGEREGWLIAATQHRDSDALARSNYRVILADLRGGLYSDDTAEETMSHWAVGHVDYLLVRPGTPAAARAEYWAGKLEDYPVADEADLGQLEWTEEWCVRCDRGTREQHPIAGCPFRSADEAEEIRARWRYRHQG